MNEHPTMTANERDLLDRFAYVAWEFMEKFGWCSMWRTDWKLATACGQCPACRLRSLYPSAINIINGDAALR